MMRKPNGYYFPNRLGRIVLLAFEEIIGKNGLNSILNLSELSSLIDNYPPEDDKQVIPFDIFSQLQRSLEQGYGPHGGRGLALRSGRAFFSNGLRTYGPDLGLNDTTFRLQPARIEINVCFAYDDRFFQPTYGSKGFFGGIRR